MWQTIAIATLVVTLLRVSPAFFKLASRLDNFPRFSRFLDYLICLITGEIIYSVAFSRVNQYSNPMTMIVVTILTIGLTAFTMHKTDKLSRSFITSFAFFILAYFIAA